MGEGKILSYICIKLKLIRIPNGITIGQVARGEYERHVFKSINL